MIFDACTIWCSYDFHKRKDDGVNMNINANNQFREILVGREDKAGFLFCQKCLSHLRDWTFPRGLFLVVSSWCWPAHLFFSHTLCRAWTADYHSQLSSCEQHLIPCQAEVGKRGQNLVPTSHFCLCPWPVHEAMISWADTADTMGLQFAEHHQSHRVQHLSGHQTNIAESAPSNTFLWFCF